MPSGASATCPVSSTVRKRKSLRQTAEAAVGIEVLDAQQPSARGPTTSTRPNVIVNATPPMPDTGGMFRARMQRDRSAHRICRSRHNVWTQFAVTSQPLSIL
jgi:hypothetical protein